MIIKITSLTFLLSLLSMNANADWVVLGVAVKCDREKKIFSVIPTVRTSSSEYDITAPDGFTSLEEKPRQNITCNIDKNTINMKINVYGPQPRGMGQGAGVIIIDSLSINKNNIIKTPTNFNWQVSLEKVLTKIQIENSSNTYNINLCYSNGWSWGAPYKEENCKAIKI